MQSLALITGISLAAVALLQKLELVSQGKTFDVIAFVHGSVNSH